MNLNLAKFGGIRLYVYPLSSLSLRACFVHKQNRPGIKMGTTRNQYY